MLTINEFSLNLIYLRGIVLVAAASHVIALEKLQNHRIINEELALRKHEPKCIPCDYM